MTRNRILITCAIASLALGLSACSSDDDDAPVTTMMDLAAETELPPLEAAQKKAADAATAAMTAAVTADEAADAAEAAMENAATMQTKETSGGHAEMARTYATAAHTAYMAAKAASEDAAAAEDVTAAVEARVAAEVAMAEAVDAEADATYHAGRSMDDSAGELKIVGTIKTVGDTSIDAGAGATSNTAGGQTTTTGLIKDLNPMTTVPAVGMRLGVADDPLTTAADQDETMAHRQAVAARDLTIGKVVDSRDDLARLMIVTQYAGTKMAHVYAPTGDANPPKSTKAGVVSITFTPPDNGAAVTRDVALRSEGMWYRAGTGNELTAGGEVLATTNGVEVFSYRDPGVPMDTAVGAVKYLVSGTTDPSETGGAATYNYLFVDALATITDADDQKVMAAIPEATEYKHIHFGVWAALDAAAKDGSQKIADLGIGFVQNWSLSGLTGADMPNNGDATYNGNWVATVRAADNDGDGPISLRHGDATLTADFGMGKIDASLWGLATLKGTITANESTFSGTKATVMAGDPYSLKTAGAYTGEFGGGFYGAKAAEAGGVFVFTSTGAKAGEFRGAFGADNDKN